MDRLKYVLSRKQMTIRTETINIAIIVLPQVSQCLTQLQAVLQRTQSEAQKEDKFAKLMKTALLSL